MIQLTPEHRQEITAHGERDYPHECCGFLIGELGPSGVKLVSETVALSNAREESAQRNRFLINPDEFVQGERYAAAKGLDVIGFYHSHPDHPAVPSLYDLEHAWPVYSYVIVAVDGGRAGDLRSWKMQEDRGGFSEEEILGGI